MSLTIIISIELLIYTEKNLAPIPLSQVSAIGAR